jgi:hypothetical protein
VRFKDKVGVISGGAGGVGKAMFNCEDQAFGRLDIVFNNAGVGAHLDGLQPWPDHGTGEDIAATVVYPASDDSRVVTGEAITIDGGLTALGLDVGQRHGQPYEVTLKKNHLNRGTPGEQTVARDVK